MRRVALLLFLLSCRAPALTGVTEELSVNPARLDFAAPGTLQLTLEGDGEFALETDAPFGVDPSPLVLQPFKPEHRDVTFGEAKEATGEVRVTHDGDVVARVPLTGRTVFCATDGAACEAPCVASGRCEAGVC